MIVKALLPVISATDRYAGIPMADNLSRDTNERFVVLRYKSENLVRDGKKIFPRTQNERINGTRLREKYEIVAVCGSVSVFEIVTGYCLFRWNIFCRKMNRRAFYENI